MARQRIEHTATTSADPATVYALLLDGSTWPQWSPINSVELERPGEDGREGVVRILQSGRVTGRDTIAELVPDRRFSYTHESSLPVKNYRADVDLEPVPEGTRIRWVSQFDPKFPGTGWLVRRMLDGFVKNLTNGLAEHASSRGSASTAPGAAPAS
jgi:hypothetical protein